MSFYYEKIRMFFLENEPTVEHLNKLWSRCLKLYQVIDMFMKIFKMIEVKQKIDAKLEANPDDENMLEKNQTMRKRLQIGIKLLLKENPVLPTAFKFNGVCLLEKLKREEKQFLNKQMNDLGLKAEETVLSDSVMSPSNN